MTKLVIINDPDIPGDVERHKRMVEADGMSIAINTWYQEVFRNRIKHGEFAPEVADMIRLLAQELHAHFRDYYGD